MGTTMLSAQDSLEVFIIEAPVTHEITFRSGNKIQGKIISEDVNRIKVLYLADTITILRSNLEHIALYRKLGKVELTTIIFPENHPEYGQELARDAPVSQPMETQPGEENEPAAPIYYELELKSGSKLIGELILETEELVVFKVGKNELQIRRKDVRSIRNLTTNQLVLYISQVSQKKYESIAGVADEYPIIWNTYEGGFSDYFSGHIGFVFPFVITTRLKVAFGEHALRGAVGWEGFIVPIDDGGMANIFRGIVTYGSPTAFVNFSYGRFVGIGEGQDMFSIGGGFELGEKFSLNIEWLILREEENLFSDTYHLILPRFDYVSQRNRFSIIPSLYPDGDNNVIVFLNYARTIGKY